MIGKTISHYKILEKLGDGGMGTVYLAEDTKLKRKIALKFLPKEFSLDPEAKKRFMREARSASSLDHANICVIHDINETEEGQMFISMNFCQGMTLQNYILEKELSLKEILKYIVQIAKGLEKAHSHKVIHCDIKSSNIIITDDGIAKIVDFGIAKIASEEKLIDRDHTSGTIAYMSPEQVSNANVDARSDIWSLGIIFYEMLTKQVPFQESYDEALMYSIINEEPAAITAINQDIPIQLEQIVNKLLKKNPDDRYQNISDLLNDLKSFNRKKDIPDFPLKIINYLYDTKNKNRVYLLFLFFVVSASIVFFKINHTPYVPSIGILNMENLGNSEDEYWSRGITKDLIINVASAGVIRVPTFNDVSKYNQSDFSIAEIAERLRVDYLLLSSIFKSDSTFDVWCRIIDPKSGKDLFAKKWNKPIENASTITTILAGSVLNNLGISSAKTIESIIIDPDAYELYLKGKHIWETRQNNNDIYLARGMLEEAIHKDPNFMKAKIQLGQTYTGTADYDRASKIFNECLYYANQAKDKNITLLAMLNIGNIHLYQHQIDKAINYYEKALKIARKRNDKYNEGKLLRNIGSSNYHLGKFDQAEKYYLQSQVLSAELDDEQGVGEALNNLGSIYMELQDYKEAMKSYKSSYDIFKKIENKSQMGYSLIGISYSWWAIGEIDSAFKYADSSLLSAREISDKQSELNASIVVGEINYCLGNNETSLDIFLKSSQLANSIGDVFNYGISNQYIGLLLMRDNNNKQSYKYFAKADSVWSLLDDLSHKSWTNSAWAFAAIVTGDSETAIEKINITETILKKTKPYKDYAPCVYSNIYNYYFTSSDTVSAKLYLNSAYQAVQERIEHIYKSKKKDEMLYRIVEYRDILKAYKRNISND